MVTEIIGKFFFVSDMAIEATIKKFWIFLSKNLLFIEIQVFQIHTNTATAYLKLPLYLLFANDMLRRF